MKHIRLEGRRNLTTIEDTRKYFVARKWAYMGNRINEVEMEGNIWTLGDLNAQKREEENEFCGKFLGFTLRTKRKDLTGFSLIQALTRIKVYLRYFDL